jgi:rod shape-determining protein MreC
MGMCLSLRGLLLRKSILIPFFSDFLNWDEYKKYFLERKTTQLAMFITTTSQEDGAKRVTFRFGLGLFFVSLILTAYSREHPRFGEYGAQIIGGFFSPAYAWTSHHWLPVKQYMGDFVIRSEVQRENRQLHQSIAALKSKVLALKEQEVENKRLRELFKSRPVHESKAILGSVIAADFGSRVYGVTIDQGSKAGVKVRSPVVNPQGVVGIVSAVSKNSAKVLLLLDPRSGVDVRTRLSRSRGVVRGNGEGSLEMEFVLATKNIESGEEVITSGMDGVFPSGLLVGTITKLTRGNKSLFRKVELTPAVDFSRLEEVLVLEEKPV